MPLEYEIDRERRRVTIVWHPPVDAAQVVDVVERQAEDGAWNFGVLHDTRANSTNTGASTGPVQTAVERLTRLHGPRGPVAIIAQPHTVGIAQAYAIRGARTAAGDIQVFWDREEAEAWLDSHTQIIDE